MTRSRGLRLWSVLSLTAVLLALHAGPVRAQWTLPVRISAEDWGKLLLMRWSKFPTLQGRQAHLPANVLDAYIWAGSDYIEKRLDPEDKALFVARYYVALEANATALVRELEPGPAIVPVRGCCAATGVRHFFMFVSLAVKQQLQERTDLFEAVEAVPPQMKVEPAGLGKLIEAADAGQQLPGAEVTLRVVLAKGAVQSLQEVEEEAAMVASVLAGVEVVVQSFRSLLVGPLLLDNAAQLARELATRPEIQWIEPYPFYETHNWFAKAVIQDGAPWTHTPYSDAGLNGKGEIVSAADTGLDTKHCFFADSTEGEPGAVENRRQRKVIRYVPLADSTDMPGGHGTHILGTLLGLPEVFHKEDPGADIYTGMAANAKLVFFDIGTSDSSLTGMFNTTIGRILDEAQASGSHIHLNAWGATLDSLPMSLNFDTWEVDNFLYQNEDFLLVLSAGNDGLHGFGAGNYTISSPATSKNALTVGASLNQRQSFQKCYEYCEGGLCPSCQRFPDPLQDNDDRLGQNGPEYVAPFSSRGPTLDGRIKPDIVAPGFRLWSADAMGGDKPGNECSITARQGTSSAAAVAAGAATLVRQYFVAGFHPSGSRNPQHTRVPSGALIKACLIHGAQHLTGFMSGLEHPTTFKIVEYQVEKFPEGYYPNIYEGWGLLRLDHVLPLVFQEKRHGPSSLWVKGGTKDQAVLQTGQRHVYSFAVERLEPFRVTLVWMDPPTALGAAMTTVNDLDLSITAPDGSVLYPNGLNSPDETNNVERIDVTNPESGVYKVAVAGTAVFAANQQPYALVVTGNFMEQGYGVAEATTPKERPPASCLYLDPDCPSGICDTVNAASCPLLAGDVRSAGRGSGANLDAADGIYGGGLGSSLSAARPAAMRPQSVLLMLAAMAGTVLLLSLR